MPRRARMYLPGVPVHIVQRGNNRADCFYTTADYERYLGFLAEASLRYGVDIHAYVLMTNHVHLCVTPAESDSISRTLALLGKNYVSYVNRTYDRTGTLWEGRHKASLIQSSTYLLTCMRYVEMNPVRARMVAQSGDYRWSSYRANAEGHLDSLVTPNDEYLALGANPDHRRAVYRALFENGVSDQDVAGLREAIHFNYPLGDSSFLGHIEQALCRAIGHDSAGRPTPKWSKKIHSGS